MEMANVPIDLAHSALLPGALRPIEATTQVPEALLARGWVDEGAVVGLVGGLRGQLPTGSAASRRLTTPATAHNVRGTYRASPCGAQCSPSPRITAATLAYPAEVNWRGCQGWWEWGSRGGKIDRYQPPSQADSTSMYMECSGRSVGRVVALSRRAVGRGRRNHRSFGEW